MSNVQLENGFTRIANELLDELCRFPFSKRQLKVMLFLARKTYGFNKKTDDLTVVQIANGTGLTRPHASATLAELDSMKCVLKRDGKRGYIIGINKNFGQWVPSQNGTRPETGTTPSQNGTDSVPKRDTQNTTSKDNLKIHKPSSPTKANHYPEDFERIWNARPRRAGSNPKPRAFEAWQARIREGKTTAEKAYEQVVAYARFCANTGKVGTEFVMQLATFFGPKNEAFLADWTPPQKQQEQGGQRYQGLVNKNYGQTRGGILDD